MLFSSRISSKAEAIFSPVWDPLNLWQHKSKDLSSIEPLVLGMMVWAVTPKNDIITLSLQMSVVIDNDGWAAMMSLIFCFPAAYTAFVLPNKSYMHWCMQTKKSTCTNKKLHAPFFLANRHIYIVIYRSHSHNQKSVVTGYIRRYLTVCRLLLVGRLFVYTCTHVCLFCFINNKYNLC